MRPPIVQLRSGSLLALVVAAALACTAPARADDPDFLSFSLGGYDINDDEDAVEARLEYRSDIHLWIFKPFSGVMLTSESAAYGYGGILLDLYFGRRLVATPSFAAGLYHNGAGKDLGHSVEFRSQIELAHRLNNRARLAVSFSHISNAGLDDRNPGTEELVLTYAVPFSVFLPR